MCHSLAALQPAKTNEKRGKTIKKLPSNIYFHINRSPLWSGLLDEFWIDLPAGRGWVCIWTGLLRVCCSTSRATCHSAIAMCLLWKKYLNLSCLYFVCYCYMATLNCLCYVNATLPELHIIATDEPLHAILSLSKGFTLHCRCHLSIQTCCPLALV